MKFDFNLICWTTWLLNPLKNCATTKKRRLDWLIHLFGESLAKWGFIKRGWCGITRSFVKSELDLDVATGLGMDGCGRGGFSVVVICDGRACEFTVGGSLVDGIRCQFLNMMGSRRGLPMKIGILTGLSKTKRKMRPDFGAAMPWSFYWWPPP